MFRFIFLLLFIPSMCFAQITKPASVDFQNNTTDLGQVKTIKCDGTTTICSASNQVGTITSSGGSSQWATSGNDIYNTNSGNVGIGTFNTNAKFDVFWRSAGTNGTPSRLTFGQSTDSPSGAEGSLRLDVVSSGAFGGNINTLVINGYGNANNYLSLNSWSGSGPASPGSRNSAILFGATAGGAATIQGPAGFTMQAFGGGFGYVRSGDIGIQDNNSSPACHLEIGDNSSSSRIFCAEGEAINGNTRVRLGDVDGAYNNTTIDIDDSIPQISLNGPTVVSNTLETFSTAQFDTNIGVRMSPGTNPVSINASSNNGSYFAGTNFFIDDTFKGNFGVSAGNSYCLSGDVLGDYCFRAEGKMIMGAGGDHIRQVIQTDGNIGIGTTLPATLFEVGVRKFNVQSGGNVGIGSITPGQKLDVNGNVRISLGSTLSVITGTNACKGQATLSSGVVTVSTNCTPSTSEGILLTDAQSSLTNVGSVTIATVTAGSSFVVQSTNILDSSKVNWFIIKSN